MNHLSSQRHLFDIPDEVAYFNCAYYSPLLIESARRLHEGVDSKRHPWKMTINDFFADAERIRELSAALFGGDTEGYAVTPAASYGLSTAGRILETVLTNKDHILVMEDEFPSVIFPLRRASQQTGAKMSTVLTPPDGDWTSALLQHINQQTRVLALSTCHWTNGAFIDLLEIRRACDAVGAILILDATQSLGAVPFSMEEIRPDFLVAAAYKWLLCPYGFSLLYVAEKWRDERPLEETWIARENAMDFGNLAKYSDVYMSGARRFEVGEKCVPTILPGAVAALEQIQSWGVKNISGTLQHMNEDIQNHLLGLGFRIRNATIQSSHMIGAIVPDSYKGDAVNALRERQIYISQRGRSLRFAPHVHIHEHDIQRLKVGLTEVFG